MKIGTIDSDNRAVISDCDSCGGHHEVLLKNLGDKYRGNTGNTHWFECPQHAQGGPVMVDITQHQTTVKPAITELINGDAVEHYSETDSETST